MQNCDPFAISFLLKVGRGRFAHGAVTQVLRWVWLRVGTPGFQPRGLHKGSVVTKFGEFEALPPRCREWGPGGTPGSDKTPSTGTRPRMYRSGRLTPAAFCLSSKESRAVTSVRSIRPGATSPPSFRRTRRDAQPISQYIRQDSDLQTSAQGEGMCCALSHASTTARAHQDRTTSGSVRRRFRGICR